MACGQQFTRVAQQLQRPVIVPTVGKLHHFACEVGLVHIDAAMPNANEIKCLRIGCPAESIDIRVECLADITFFAGRECIDTQSVAIAFVSVVFHALPSYVFAVGRELWVGVVPHVVIFILLVDGLVFHRFGGIHLRFAIVGGFAEINRFTGGEVIEIDV